MRDLTHAFIYNDLASLATLFDQHPGEFAAVILEPMNVAYPEPGFLEGVKALAHQQGALLIFDETITGFRFSNGGASELFGVVPDLATFGKGLANGFPVSAVAGRRDVMKLMEQIFFSFTFGGETLSLAAAKATLTKLREEPVVQTLSAHGQAIFSETTKVIDNYGLGEIFSMSGHPSWTFLNIRDGYGSTALEIKTFLMQELHERGILCLGAHNVNYAHSLSDIQKLVDVYGELLPLIGETLRTGTLIEKLRTTPLVPLFKLR